MRDRKPTRLKGFDYKNSGYYFVTTCVKNPHRLCRIVNKQPQLYRAGRIVEKCWLELISHYKNCYLDYYVIMPDHFHGIIIIDNNIVGEGLRPSPTFKIHSLTEIIRAFKSFSSRRINEQNIFKTKFQWQRSFYDRIIRNERELYFIRKYISENPFKWELYSTPIPPIF